MGNEGNDLLQGGDDHDELIGDEGDDTLEGGAGNDRLEGGAGSDRLVGGADADTYVLSDANDTIVEEVNGGVDTIELNFNANSIYVLEANLENLLLRDTANTTAQGNRADNAIYGNQQDNLLYGMAGDDSLYGREGRDTLFGEEGRDLLKGGAGDDELNGGTGSDRFVFNNFSNDGVDRLVDFNPTEDFIALYTAFSYFGDGYTAAGFTPDAFLSGRQFRIGERALDSSDRIIYDRNTGKLYFDQDGTGSFAQVQIAQLPVGLALSHNNIYAFTNEDSLKPINGPGTNPPDDEPPPLSQLSLSDVTLAEDNNGITNAIFTVRLSGASAQPVTVEYATGDDTAIAGSDYTTTSGTLTFAPGELTKTITVQVNGDAIVEGDERFILRLKNVINGAIIDGEGIGIIVNDDLPPQPNQPTSGSDRLTGSTGNDTIDGLAGDDTILGLDGNDSLIGGDGNDSLNGGRGNDRIWGGTGSDRLWGGTGNDTLWSGAGKDVIALERGMGRIVVKDFSDRSDKLGLTPGLRYNQLQFTQQGKNVLISAGSDPLAVLIGVNKNQISRADFTTITTI